MSGGEEVNAGKNPTRELVKRQLDSLTSEERRKLLREYGRKDVPASQPVASLRMNGPNHGGHVVHHQSWSGPIPPAAELERVNQIVPGGADRLIKVFEKQVDHRMGLETRVIRAQLFQSTLGQIFAFILGLFIL